jgi:hypothetical protein
MSSLAKTASTLRVNYGVAVADQVTETRRLLLERPRKLAGLLCDPSASGVRGAAGEVDAAAAELDEEEDV